MHFDITMEQSRNDAGFALCIDRADDEDLDKGKVYPVIPDDAAAREGYLRVIDESQEDYLYPESYFVLLELPLRAREALFAHSYT
ncbi:MAG: hypothetical protein BECKG1743D_GA0114223_100325 [Candidatus Kentron sp. G]|nr:MAG: hypothetical protein BECKG1743F_GA0114225_100356 [Candidatus Kentron sp. G]VFM95985.1 MAG: hypothetical protein BECKG1743E_GA0114224_100295 [Candidatus Kentron sp. G]VFM97820.1 MAG: hypothetical protein BECKG1743D_GA0114223_100325 [Candidatus Kentron sp. G]